MTKKTLTLRDLSFYGQETTSKFENESPIKWDRSEAMHEVCVFTDLCLHLAKQNIYKHFNKVALVIEPYAINQAPYHYLEKNYKDFSLILTHHNEFNQKIPDGKAELYKFGTTWIAENDRAIHRKSKNISIIASNKAWTEGHILRHDIVDKIGKNIDVFGYAYKPLANKISGMSDYRFHIAIENSFVDCYFTEKLIDCFLTGCVPVYKGAPKSSLLSLFDTSGMVFLDEETPIGKIPSLCTEKLYDTMKDSIERNFKLAQEYLCAENSIFPIINRRFYNVHKEDAFDKMPIRHDTEVARFVNTYFVNSYAAIRDTGV